MSLKVFIIILIIMSCFYNNLLFSFQTPQQYSQKGRVSGNSSSIDPSFQKKYKYLPPVFLNKILSIPDFKMKLKNKILSKMNQKIKKSLIANSNLKNFLDNSDTGSMAAVIEIGIVENIDLNKVIDAAFICFMSKMFGGTDSAEEFAYILFEEKFEPSKIAIASRCYDYIKGLGAPMLQVVELLYYAIRANIYEADIYTMGRAYAEAVKKGIPPEKIALSFIFQIETGAYKKYPMQTLAKSQIRNVMRILKKRGEFEIYKKYYKKGYQYYKEKQYDQAIQKFLEALQAKPDFLKSRYWLAKSYYKKNWHYQAKQELNEILSANPRDQNANKLLIKVKKAEKRFNVKPHSSINRQDLLGYQVGFSGFKKTNFISEVNKYLGMRYILGGKPPRGIDCSLFTQSVYKAQGINLPRVSYQQAKKGYEVPIKEAKFGDLLCFDLSRRGKVHHVGIFLGYNKISGAPGKEPEGAQMAIVHASAGAHKKVVQVPYTNWWKTRTVSVKRLYK